MQRLLYLCDEHGTHKGETTWEDAHHDGKLHVAFSVYIFRTRDGVLEILIQQRSSKKPLFKGIWANTCCSHPRVGEETVDAGQRRLLEECGIQSELRAVGTIVYRAQDPGKNGWEHEHVTLLRGDVPANTEALPNPDEIERLQWIAVQELQKQMQEDPERFAPWFHMGLSKVLTAA